MMLFRIWFALWNSIKSNIVKTGGLLGGLNGIGAVSGFCRAGNE